MNRLFLIPPALAVLLLGCGGNTSASTGQSASTSEEAEAPAAESAADFNARVEEYNNQQQVVLLQTTAAISGGSSGGGLFDDNGVLIGLTTIGSVSGDAQNLNFAIPVDWVRDLPRRHARLSKPAASAASSVPAAVAAPLQPAR